MPPNQNPEQLARNQIDAQLRACGWAIQDKNAFNPNEGGGQAVREYTTDSVPADCVLFLVRQKNKDMLIGSQLQDKHGYCSPSESSYFRWYLGAVHLHDVLVSLYDVMIEMYRCYGRSVRCYDRPVRMF